jgi:hypothetical protein
MAEMKDSTAMAQGQKARSRSDILREHCNCLHSLLSLDSIDLKDVGKDDEINRVVFLGDYCEDAWAAIKIVAPLCDAQELVDSLQPVMKERKRLRSDGLSLHEYYMSLCRTSDDFVIQEGGVYSVHEDLDRSVWEEFQATIGDYTPRFPSWLSWERDQVGNNLSGILSALRKTVSQAMMILELWLLPTTTTEMQSSIITDTPNVNDDATGSTGEWVGPCSKTEMARRLSNDAKARWRKFEGQFDDAHIRTVSAKQHYFRVDHLKLSPPEKERCRKPFAPDLTK